MRETKFRAWEKNRREMLEVLGIFFDVGTIKHPLLKVRGNTNLFNEGYPNTYFEDIELMQYTGLKDKNGKEIYEGDIVKDFYGKILQVSWADRWARYMMSYDGEWCQYYLEDYHGNKTDRMAKTMEVIGNIYENKELLKD